MKRVIFILAVISFFCAACQKSTESVVREGVIELNLSSDGDFATKAASAMSPEQKSEYKITVFSGETVAYGPVTVAEFESSSRRFPAGTYTVKVENVTSLESETDPSDNSSFGLAWVNGTGQVTVAAAVNPVTVACTPKNSRVTLENVSISLASNGDLTDGRTVEYTLDSSDHSSAKAAYFKPGTLAVTVNATTTPSYGSASKTFGSNFTLEPAQWSKITLSATAEGSVSVTITVDTEYGEKDETIVLNPYE